MKDNNIENIITLELAKEEKRLFERAKSEKQGASVPKKKLAKNITIRF